MRRRGVMGRRALLALCAALAIAGGAASGPAAAAEAGDPAPLKIVATTGMIADAVRAVGGEAAEVRALMGPGVDPHAYRQNRSDVLAMTRADIVFWNGLYLEAQMESFLLRLGERSRVVALAEAAPTDRLIAHDDYPDRQDPHLWMEPALWAQTIAAIRDAMIAERPAQAALFTANAQAYVAELEALDAYGRKVLGSVPEESRVLLTAHDAFNYFGRAYDFEVMGVQGISTESEAGVARIAELARLLAERRIGAVFVETSVSDRNMRALIEGAAAEGHAVAIGAELYSDAMGPKGSYEGGYLGMMDHNFTAIARALGGEAPVGGRLGRLALPEEGS
ncbi:MAG: zinc ABC transporter substrate-binding protein [Pseudomonadota bacterium]